MKHDKKNILEKPNDSTSGKQTTQPGETPEIPKEHDRKNQLKADPLYQFLKPLHNLPRGKNTWDPQIIRKWWFWPLSALFLILLSYIYPLVWDFFAG